MISTLAQQISPSETLKISAKAKELAREGRDVISLSAGEPDFKTPSHICNAAIDAITAGFHGYTMNTGMPELREAICAKLLRDNRVSYSADQIVCSNGAKQSIGFSILATINSGDDVIIPAPYWVSYPQMVKMAGGVPVTVSTDFSNKFKLTGKQLREAITEKTRGLILCSPSNPTGSSYSAEELKELADVLKDYPDIVIFSDEIYEYIIFEGEHTNILNVAPELKDRTLIINGFSKGFAMTGWRLGYTAGPKPIIDAIAKIQSQETSAPSTISQKAGIAAYTGPMKPVTEMRDDFKKRRDFMVTSLQSIQGVECFTPDGAFYLFPNIGAYIGKTTEAGDTINSSTDLAMYLLESHNVATVPGDAFGEPNGLRLSYASSMVELKEAVRRLRGAFASLRG